MEIKNQNILNKFIDGKSHKERLGSYEKTLYYLYRKIGYEETLNLPIPVFIGIIKSLNEEQEEIKKSYKK